MANRTKKLREEAEKDRKERGENPRKKHKGEKGSKSSESKKQEVKPQEGEAKPEAAMGNEEQGQPEGEMEGGNVPEDGEGQGRQGADRTGLKYELQQRGKEKCRFYPFCKNLEKCPYFHPS